jgi:hypothetical protein
VPILASKTSEAHIFVRQHRPRLLAALGLLALLAAVLWIYLPAVNFGFIWDDPLWYGRVVDAPLGDLIRPMPDYQFYRPVLVLYNRLFVQPDHTLAIGALHALQIGWHVLQVILLFFLASRLGLPGWPALAAAGLVAFYPFSYQAVAWAAPSQPLAAALLVGAWLAYVLARQRREGRRPLFGLSLLLYVAALGVTESAATLAGLPLLLEWVLRRQGVPRQGWWWSLVYPLLAGGFGLLWLVVPRQSGFTALRFDPKVAVYLLQGIVFPWLGRPGGYATGQSVSGGVILSLAVLTVAGLLVAAWAAGRLRTALLALAWALLPLIPPIAGLEYDYASLSPRLLHSAGSGVALLWATALLPVSSLSGIGESGRPAKRRKWPSPTTIWRAAGLVLTGLILIQSGRLLSDFRQLYAAGTAHVAELVDAAPEKGGRLLFVNFPDRYARKRPPFPMGYWGLTLTPVVVDLGAFPGIATGKRPETSSYSMPWLDTDARDAGPYDIALRGEITPPETLYRAAYQADGVYLSRARADGTFRLDKAGGVRDGSPDDAITPGATCKLAVWEEAACLQSLQIERRDAGLVLTSTWLSLAPAGPHTTLFAHLGPPGEEQIIAQSDGDAWLGMLPPSVWQPGDTIWERRLIPLPDSVPPGPYIVRVGMYDWVTGQRLVATTPAGEPLPGNAFNLKLQP